MQAWVTRTTASVGSTIAASGTSSTRMSRGPWYTLALMPALPLAAASMAAYGRAAVGARGDYASGMDPEAPRRRPRQPPPAPPEPPGAAPPEEEVPPPRRGGAFAVVWWAALALVVVVVIVAFATGTADDLPWGAIIGVLAVLGFALIALRRRAAALAAGEDGEDEDDAGDGRP